MPSLQKIFSGRPNILVGQPMLVQPKYNPTKTYCYFIQKYDLEVDLFKKDWPKNSQGRPFSFYKPGL